MFHVSYWPLHSNICLLNKEDQGTLGFTQNAAKSSTLYVPHIKSQYVKPHDIVEILKCFDSPFRMLRCFIFFLFKKKRKNIKLHLIDNIQETTAIFSH